MSGQRIQLGWREWLALPELGLPAIKAKVDTGARTSALHVDGLELFEHDRRVRFSLRPGAEAPPVTIETEVIDIRQVTDSGGRTSHRPFIRTVLHLAGHSWPIEINLTSRSAMLFPMLLGRTALAGRFHIDPDQSFILGGDTDTP